MLTDIVPRPRVGTRAYKGRGSKANRVRTTGFKWADARIEGQIGYNDLVYLLSCHWGVPIFTSQTATWVPAADAAELPRSMSVQVGQASQAEKFAYGVIPELALRFNLTEPGLSGAMFGRKITESATLTATPTEIAPVPVSEVQWQVKVGTLADLSDLTLLTRVKEFEFRSSGKWTPGFYANQSQTSFTEEIENEHNIVMRLAFENNSVAAGYMTQFEAATALYLQLSAIGPGGAAAYQILLTAPVQFSDNDRDRADGIQRSVMSLEPIYKAAFNTTGGFIKMAITSDVTAIP